MWHLTLGGGGGGGGESYPERHGVPNCVYYMRTGFCGYGGRCRFNHPRDRAAVTLFVIFIYLHFAVDAFFVSVMLDYSPIVLRFIHKPMLVRIKNDLIYIHCLMVFSTGQSIITIIINNI